MAKYTPTMARLYADQGYLHKAAELYRHLVERYPDRPDLQHALSQVQQQIKQQQVPSKKELCLMIREWIDLMNEVSHRQRSTPNDQRRKNDPERVDS